MQKALEFSRENSDVSLNKIAKDFGVGRKALKDRQSGAIEVNAQVGPRGKLSKEEENILKNHLIEMAALGFGYNAFQVTELVRSFLNKNDVQISDTWVFHFLERHPEISKRRAQSLEKQRLGALDEATTQAYFDLLKLAFSKCKDLSNGIELTAGRVFAADEVGFSNENTQTFILTRKGDKHPFVVASNISQHVTLMAFAAANGWVGSEYFLLPGVRQRPAFNTEMKKYFPDAEIQMTPKGYMTEASFISWADFFVRNIQEVRADKQLWCLLVVDGHSSHAYSVEALKLLNENRIMLISLPSHATHILQVHDIAIFHPLKEQFKLNMAKWKKQNGLNFQIQNFPEVLSPAWESANSSTSIKNGFRTTGLWPLNLNWINENKSKIPIRTSPEERFDLLCKKYLLNSPGGKEELLDHCKHLDLAISAKKPPNINQFEKSLDKSLHQAENSVLQLQKRSTSNQRQPQNSQENSSQAKILNDPRRIEHLEAKKKKTQDAGKKDKINTKKLMKSKTSPIEDELLHVGSQVNTRGNYKRM